MASYGTYKLNEKKCATCSFWSGERNIVFSANKPWRINAVSGNADCIAVKNKKASSAQTCLKWQLWEKL
jgi:hypothetical protein